ncbi:MAG: hypothetical protein ACLQM8_10085 [Limisphaerales bacterium]
MMPPNVIPALDPNPLPAPYWVFKLLLLVTFFLHIVAMNFLLGGGVLALLSKWRSRNREGGNRLFLDVAKKLPVLLPATVTLGIAPLLFVQVLYGQFFYTSSIVMAWPWFLVLVFLTIAYYGFYYASYRSGRPGGRTGEVMLLSVMLIFLVGFLFSNNLTLSQTPWRWAGKYFADPAGWNLNLAEPALFPRFLHFFTAAVAVGGLFLVFVALANWKRDREYARQILQFGGKAFMYATMAQFVVGIVFLVSLPRDQRMLFMGDNPLATSLLLIGVTGGGGGIFLMSDALRKENLRAAAFLVPGILAVVIACMSVMRDLLRDAYLKPYFHPGQFAVKTQWSVLPLFLVLFLAGVILWLVMLKRYGLLGGK